MAAAEKLPITRPPFGAWVSDDLTREILLPVASDHGWTEESVRAGGISSAVRTLSASPCPEILLVDLSESSDPRTDMQQLAEVCDPETAVIALGIANDVALYRDLLHAGVQDYLVKPVSDQLFADALLAAKEVMTSAHQGADLQVVDPDQKRQIAFVGLRGGLGASSLAAHVAVALSEQPQSTMLVDMDLSFGVGALMFDLEPGRGLVDALDNPSRVDGLFLERAVVKPTTNLSVLAAEAPIGSLGASQVGALKSLIGVLADSFSSVVIDLPRQAMMQHLDALQDVTDIVLVTDLSLCGARDTIRMIGYLEKEVPGITIHVVAAKVGQMGGEVSQADFENSIERSLLASLPYDGKAFLTAAKQGSTLFETAKGSKATHVIRDIANALNPLAKEDTQKTGGFIKSLFARS